MVEYRRSLAASFLFRFFVDVALKLEADNPGYKAGDWLREEDKSAAVHFERPASHGVQYFDKAGDQNVVGQPFRHMAADLQVCLCALPCPGSVRAFVAHDCIPCWLGVSSMACQPCSRIIF